MKWFGCAIFAFVVLSAGRVLPAQQWAVYNQPEANFPAGSVIAPDWPAHVSLSGTSNNIVPISYQSPEGCYDGSCLPMEEPAPYFFGTVRPSHPARWLTGFDVLYMTRVGEQSQGLIYRQLDDVQVFSTSEFDFDRQFAYRGFAQYNISTRWAVEGIFTKLQNDWNASDLASDGLFPDVEPIELRAAGIVVVSPTETFDMDYNTEFQTGELNTKYYLNDWSIALIGGFRWGQVDERMSAVITGTANPFSINTTNDLYGGQFGVESQHWLGYGVMRLDVALKGGIFRNNSSLDIAQVGVATASDSQNSTAWLGEAEIGLTMPIFRHGNLRAGYRVIHMAGLAIAADQINSANLNVPSADLNNDGQALYHGFSLGFEYWF